DGTPSLPSSARNPISSVSKRGFVARQLGPSAEPACRFWETEAKKTQFDKWMDGRSAAGARSARSDVSSVFSAGFARRALRPKVRRQPSKRGAANRRTRRLRGARQQSLEPSFSG